MFLSKVNVRPSLRISNKCLLLFIRLHIQVFSPHTTYTAWQLSDSKSKYLIGSAFMKLYYSISISLLSSDCEL